MNDEDLEAEGAEQAGLQLTVNELRVLGCLVEKQATTPEVYPLTQNALVLACNQKTNREPLMNMTQGEVGQALRSLEAHQLARLVIGSRADRWEQRADKTLELVAPQLALMALLMLRGPQTINELLTRSLRLHAFDDAEQVQYNLERLIGRQLVCHVPKQSGQREDRYMHLLGDAAQLQASIEASAAGQDSRSAAKEVNEERLQALELKIAELEQRLERLEG
ncbi:YceH family protein [Pseudomonas sp. EL_65y_Pfl2_R95]|uniref:YceH family protein n=1 Tax=Pseudomonas sp. EL_65y_Pfl2_R95 TaxID=3088698 RepID=UPI0030D9B419